MPSRMIGAARARRPRIQSSTASPKCGSTGIKHSGHIVLWNHIVTKLHKAIPNKNARNDT